MFVVRVSLLDAFQYRLSIHGAHENGVAIKGKSETPQKK
jgi:hypothetical protein